MTWEEVALKKRADNLSKIPTEWIIPEIPSVDKVSNVNPFIEQFLTPLELRITNDLTGVEITHLISIGELSSLDVTSAFCHRSALVHQLTNCLSEIFYDRALVRAKELDEYQAKYGKTMGPLHGLPISLKDQINLKGIDTSIGYVAPLISKEFQNLICQKDCDDTQESLIAQILYEKGCVFYVKTTVPTAMLGVETVSNLFGDTLNSLNRNLSCSGSSGGEGSLIGGHGSLIGLGTDIGGSIRNPSLSQGIYGLRASSNRFTYLNVSNSYPDQTIVPSVVGPMARNIEDMELITRIIFDAQAWLIDPKVIPLPFQTPVLKDKLKIGFFKWDGVVMPHPPIVRGIEKVADVLNSNGHEAIDLGLPPVSHLELATLLTKIFTADALTEVKEFAKLSGEPFSALIKRSFNPPAEKVSVEEFMDFARQKYKFQQDYDNFWNSTSELTYDNEPIDGFLIAGNASTSWKIGENMKVAHCYTRFVNVLDYVSITIPVATVDRELDLPLVDYKPVSAMDENAHKYYDPEMYHGMPITLQLVVRRYQEEKAIKLAQVISNLLNK